MGATGPKVSSSMIRIPSCTSTSTVGAYQQPPEKPSPVMGCPPVSTRAPLATASSTWDFTFSSPAASMRGPIWTSSSRP